MTMQRANRLGPWGCLLVGLAACTGAETPAPVQLPAGIAAPVGPHRWQRATSTDPTGGNKDYVPLPAGAETTLATLEGSGEIRHMWMTYFEPPGEPDSLRKLALAIYWDGLEQPSVLCPLGDFFALGNGAKRTLTTEFTSVTPKLSLNSFFPMPFAKGARVAIRNDSQTEFPGLYYTIEYAATPPVERQPSYFHAQYRQAFPARDGEPYTVARIEGRGAYLGTQLSVVLNSTGWWGEGDDILTVDGVRNQGTGTEDYFCGSWNFGSTPSSTPRLGAPQMDGLESAGAMWSVYRFHSSFPIPFDKGLTFELEHGFRENDGRAVSANSYASVAYYYLDAPQGQEALPPAKDRVARAIIPPRPGPGEPIEAEDAFVRGELELVSGGLVALERIDRTARHWRGNTIAQLTGLRPDARFAWVVPVEQSMVFAPVVEFLCGPYFADFDTFLNGRPIGPTNPAYQQSQLPAKLQCPPVRLEKGNAIFEFIPRRFSGPEPNPVLNIGLDRLALAIAREDGASYMDGRPAGARFDSTVHEAGCAEGKWTDSGGMAGGITAIEGAPSRVLLRRRTGELNPEFLTVEARIKPGAAESREFLAEQPGRFAISIEKGAVEFSCTSADGELHRVRTPAGVLAADAWSLVRVSAGGGRLRVFVNDALLAEAGTGVPRRLRDLGEATHVGSTAEGSMAFTGEISRVVLSTATAPPAAGEGG